MALRVNGLNKSNCVQAGSGPDSSILLCLWNTGLGTVPHILPAIKSLVDSRHAVTVNCKPFQIPMYEALGVTVMSKQEPLGQAWFLDHKDEFGKIVSLQAWDAWECTDLGFHRNGTMDEIAEILGVELPKEFSWEELWGCTAPDKSDPYILFNAKSLEVWRTLPESTAKKILNELTLSSDIDVFEIPRMETWQELRDLIHGASLVVTVEGGISNIAGALNVPLVCLTGMVEVESTVEQYRRYIPDLILKIVKGFRPPGCAMPCYRQPSRGFKNGKCLGHSEIPICLQKIDIPKIATSVSTLIPNQHVTP